LAHLSYYFLSSKDKTRVGNSARMPKVYGSYKTGADIYKDTKSGKYYILEWNPQTRQTYKKFISFTPLPEDIDGFGATTQQATIKKSKTRKLRRTQKKQKQKQTGGLGNVPGQMPSGECATQVLNTPSYKNILAQLNLADPAQTAKDIKIIRARYTQNPKFANKRLVDVIYDLPKSGIKQMLGQLTCQTPKMCWDHGIGNADSITGGAVGIHVYVADLGTSTGIPNWSLVGVFILTKPAMILR